MCRDDTGEAGSRLATPLWIQLPANVLRGRQQMKALVLQSDPHEGLGRFPLATGLGLAQPGYCNIVGNKTADRDLYLPLCLSNENENK